MSVLLCKKNDGIKIENRLKRQIKLVVLDKSQFPEDIVTKFNEDADEKLEPPQPKVAGATMISAR